MRFPYLPIAALLLAMPASGLFAQPAEAPPKLDVAYVPTTDAAVSAMLRLARVKADDVVYDLGCGDGRIVIEAARLFGARGVGIDIDPQRIREANENARKAGVASQVKFIEQDLFEADFREATVVTLFLLMRINRELRPKLLEQLAPGTRIVSNTFSFGVDWEPEREIIVPGSDEADWLSRRLFLFVVPERP